VQGQFDAVKGFAAWVGFDRDVEWCAIDLHADKANVGGRLSGQPGLGVLQE
jgi:hypothetical protein